ncbi:unnamed protein product [Effrenium voratum]|nr:unnamed protein product [Effrenium voratum]
MAVRSAVSIKSTPAPVVSYVVDKDDDEDSDEEPVEFQVSRVRSLRESTRNAMKRICPLGGDSDDENDDIPKQEHKADALKVEPSSKPEEVGGGRN